MMGPVNFSHSRSRNRSHCQSGQNGSCRAKLHYNATPQVAEIAQGAVFPCVGGVCDIEICPIGDTMLARQLSVRNVPLIETESKEQTWHDDMHSVSLQCIGHTQIDVRANASKPDDMMHMDNQPSKACSIAMFKSARAGSSDRLTVIPSNAAATLPAMGPSMGSPTGRCG